MRKRNSIVGLAGCLMGAVMSPSFAAPVLTNTAMKAAIAEDLTDVYWGWGWGRAPGAFIGDTFISGIIPYYGYGYPYYGCYDYPYYRYYYAHPHRCHGWR